MANGAGTYAHRPVLANKALLILAAVSSGLLAAFLSLTFEAKIVIGLLLGLSWGFVILLRPDLGVIFLVVTMPVLNIFPPTFFGSGMANPTNLVLAWVAFSICLRRILVERTGIARRSFLPPLVAYAVVIVYSMLQSLLHGGGTMANVAEMTRTYLNGAFLYFLAANVIDDERRARRIFTAVLVTVSLIALWGIVEYRSEIASGVSASRVRISGRVGQPNSFGAFLAMYLPFLVGMVRYVHIRGIVKLAIAGSTVACFTALLLTQSRGAYLGVIASVLFLAVAVNRKLFLVILVAGLAHPLWMPDQVRERVTMTFQGGDDGGYDESTEARLTFYRAGFEMFKSSPLVGHGFGAFNRLVVHMGYSDRERASHSLYVQMLAETGIAGMGTLLVMLVYLGRRAYRLWRRSTDPFFARFGESYLACLVALVVVNAFGVRFYNFLEIGYFWILSAILIRFSEPARTPLPPPIRRPLALHAPAIEGER